MEKTVYVLRAVYRKLFGDKVTYKAVDDFYGYLGYECEACGLLENLRGIKLLIWLMVLDCLTRLSIKVKSILFLQEDNLADLK